MAQDNNKLVITPHADGVARLAFSPDGRYLYTSGYEGLMRIFDARPDAETGEEPAIIDYHQEGVTSIAASSEYLASACETGEVILHKAGQTELDGFLTRFSLPARSVRFDPRGKRAVVTSDEVIAKVIAVKEPTKIQLLTGHSRSIREASWSPDGHFVTTSSVDGQIRVWQLDSGTEPTCVQVLDGLIKAENAESDYSVEAVWHPAGKFFVVPGKDTDIAIVSRESWQKTGAFADQKGHTGRVSAVAFSANGLYLASAAADESDILIWSVKDRSIIARTPHTHGLITSLAFHPAPGANSLAYIDNKGQLTRWQGPVPANLAPPSNARAPAKEAGNNHAARTSKAAEGAKGGAGRKRSDSASTSTSSHAGGNLFRREASEDEFDDPEMDNALEGWIDDDLAEGGLGDDDDLDLGGGAANEFPDDVPLLSRSAGAGGDHRARGRSSVAPRERFAGGSGGAAPREKGQAPFQVGATPWREQRRYLAFNMIGYIYAVERDEGQAVTIEFHDRSAHIASKFDDRMKYNLGALGELGAVFSCRSLRDHPAQIFYKPYESWTSIQTWSASLPAGEDATVLAIGGVGQSPDAAAFDDPTVGLTGSGTILVATSRNFVRFFSGAGLQKYLWNVGEEVVTMAAAQDWAMIVHRASGGGAALEYSLIDTDTFEVVQQGKVPVQQGATLSWIGFTDENIPVMYDSKGLLSILDRSRRPRQGRWLPLLDTQTLSRREGKQESYWPVGVSDHQAHVVILKGGEQYPHFPTPLLQDLELQMPLVNLDVPQGQLAEKYMRESVFVQHRKDGAPSDDFSLKTELARVELQTEKHLLQIIQTFCKADKLEAALDAVLLLSQPASLVAASKIAGFFTLPALQERIDLLQQMRDESGDPEAAAAKRQSKWAHLADDRYITSNGANGGGGFGGPSNSAANLFGPGSADAFGSSRRSFGTPSGTQMSSTTSRKKRKSMPDTSQAAAPGFVGSDEAEPNGFDDDLEYVDAEVVSSPKRMRLDSDEAGAEEEEAPAPPPPKKALNPFAKRPAAPKQPPSRAANPFSDKKAGKTKDLGRTDSFFNRLEGKEPPKGKGKASAASKAATAKSSGNKVKTLPGGKQTTLFGLPPPRLDDSDKKSKKRKPTPEEDGSQPSSSKVASSSKAKLEAFRSTQKPASAATGGLGAEAARELPREGEEMEETQLLDETQEESMPMGRTTGDLLPAAEEAEGEGGDGDDEDTQMSETQIESQSAAPDLSREKENERPSGTAPATSKLAQFAFKKAPAVEVAPVEVEEDETAAMSGAADEA
ncbi:hypothetical protein JCM10908_005761 [Rhodotorula pacifica]|uniref:chromatin-binding protein CTF4 n=1 Tax=Rhodotorula pacifica TaxID=1495444 RepID=UPI0031764495